MFFFMRTLQKTKGDLLAALDIGSTKICCAIARGEATPDKIRLLGIGQHASRGIKNASITDLDALEDSILNAVHTAEQMAGITLKELYVSLPGTAVSSYRLRSELLLSKEAVNETHLRRLIAMNPSHALPAGLEVVHAVPLFYTLDGNKEIRDPLGMHGEKLGVSIHLLAAPSGFIKNLKSCIGRCHLDVQGFVLNSYASSLSCLVEDEMELGATLIDMGGGATTFSSFMGGHLLHVGSVAIGGNHVTHDIARGLATPLAEAERMKTLYGNLIDVTGDDKELIPLPQLGDAKTPQLHQIPKSLLIYIIRSRVEEVLELVGKKLKAMDPLLQQRIVITGGASQLVGLKELAQQVWERQKMTPQIRIGSPKSLSGMSYISDDPAFSTCAGLLHYGKSSHTVTAMLTHGNQRSWRKITAWIRENF